MKKIPIYPTFKLGTTPVFLAMYDGEYISMNTDMEFHFSDIVDEHIEGFSLFHLTLGGLYLIGDIDNLFGLDLNYDDNRLKIIGVDLL